MKKAISLVALVSMFAAGSAYASGWRIPEQSMDSTAKSGANIASADSSDVTYYNPANMSSLPDAWQVEGTLTYIHLTGIDYDDNRSRFLSGSSTEEDFLLPTLFIVSPDYNNFRFGFSITEPAGLQKRWKDPYPRTFSEKYSLRVIEFNPTISYKVNDMLSIGGGLRLLYNEATVMSVGMVDMASGTIAGRYLKGDTTEWGYNLALHVEPAENWSVALTYRSNVDMDFEGDALLFSNTGPTFASTASVTAPVPAVLALSVAYTWEDWTFDLTVDQTYWSEYEALDFDYDQPVTNPLLFALFDLPNARNWDDTIAVRLGVEYQIDEKTTLMAGIAYDENPAPEATISFELPDSDAWLFSIGARYKLNDQLDLGAGLLYDYKENRDVVNRVANGEFSNASAFLFSFGLNYTF